MNKQHYFDRISNIESEAEFRKVALEIFKHQAERNIVYSEFVRSLHIDPNGVGEIENIPFLPVEIFKSKTVVTGDETHEHIFTSSGTTDENVSRHFIKDLLFYEKIFSEIFSRFYGNPDQYTLLALLPSYLERNGSSLVYMAEKLIQQTNNSASGFYLYEHEKLHSELIRLKNEKKKAILLGVTYALLDFCSDYPINFPELIVMETGGMKGKRKEMVREEVHDQLCKGFGVEKIHSEYGMTELLSQAYSAGDGIFKCPPWMRIHIRDPYDPMMPAGINKSGGINIIDLANVDSCSFLSTQDLGKVYKDYSFEVIGRFDFSDIRGCNLMID